jgi:Serine hydrolase (FSH1)
MANSSLQLQGVRKETFSNPALWHHNQIFYDPRTPPRAQPHHENPHNCKEKRKAINTQPELEGVVDGPFYKHYDRDNTPGSELTQAIEHTQQIIAEQGPFDVVLGFSQGAALGASLIVDHAKTHPGQPPLFRAAVFLCGATPWESSGLVQVQATPDTYPINIPTANVVGKQDFLYEQSMALYRLCEPSKATFYDHGSKHMIPFDLKNQQGMIKIIDETIAMAMGV